MVDLIQKRKSIKDPEILDELLYEIDQDRVILTKARRGKEGDDPFRTFDEWNSDADKKAYGRL